MADLFERTDNALNETRILMLLGQVLFAYGFESAFEKTFAALPQLVRWSALTASTLLAVSMAFLLTPASFHWLVERCEDTPGFHGLTTRVVDLVLPIFAAAMSIEVFVMAARPFGARAAAGVAALIAAAAFFFLVGLELLARRRRRDSA